MKKIYSFALLLLTLFSSALFFACGNKYKDLDMSFYSQDGEAISSLNLTLDSNNENKANAKVCVKFSGIDEEDIGQIVAYSTPNELVTISNYNYDGASVWFNVSANIPSLENAKLMVRHLDSNQLKSIDLKINQKSTNLQINNANYIISIPTIENVETRHIMQTSSVLSLHPAGSTDKVYYLPNQTTFHNIYPLFQTAPYHGKNLSSHSKA